MTAVKMASGIELATTIMERQLPRKNRIIRETSSEASSASRTTPCTAARTNTDWSKSSFSSSPVGATCRMAGSASLAASTTARVEASACLRMAR